jgi:hypothetical protein
LFAGAEQSLNGDGHVREQKRVGKVFEARLKKLFNGGRFAETAIEQALREQGRDFELRRQLTGKKRLRRRERPAEFHWAYVFDELPVLVRFSRSATMTDSTMAIKMIVATVINETPVGIST